MAGSTDLALQFLAGALDIAPNSIDAKARFDDLEGWDSLTFMRFITALETHLKKELDPMVVIELEDVPAVIALLEKHASPEPAPKPRIRSLSTEDLIAGYRAECHQPPTAKIRKLSQNLLAPNLKEIERDLLVLREETDAYFFNLQEEIKKGQRTVGTDTRRKLMRYPIKCCLEITRHMLRLVSTKQVPAEMTGIWVLREFCKEGGKIHRIWGGLRGIYFQNATQAGSFYIDVANDTVDPKKPKVEILPFEESDFKNIESYEEFAAIAEPYWHCRIAPNTYFPTLAPFFPMLAFFSNGEVRIESANAYMFPMNLDNKFKMARRFVFSNRLNEGEETQCQKIMTDLISDPENPLSTYADSFCPTPNKEKLEAAFAEVAAFNLQQVNAKLGEVLQVGPPIGRSKHTLTSA